MIDCPDFKHLQKNSITKFNLDINKDDITIVLPVLNEEKGIGKIIEEIQKEGYNDIMIVDGFSDDSTVSIASSYGVSVIYQKGIGKTSAIKTAINNITKPYIIIMDGDCTYDPSDIIKFYPYINKNNQVIGMRILGKKNIPILNRFGNWFINLTFNILFKTNLNDVCSGMYMLRTDFAKTLQFFTSGFDVEVEIAAQAASVGQIMQVPINYYKRVGKQKLKPVKDGIQIIITILRLAYLRARARS